VEKLVEPAWHAPAQLFRFGLQETEKPSLTGGALPPDSN